MTHQRSGVARTVLGLAVALAVALAGAGRADAAEGDRRLVLVTLDGLSWTDVFRGADPERAADPAFVTERKAIADQFLAPADRAQALMPFLHGVMARQGVLIGDRDHGSCVAVANDKWFSYPGYNEILTGRPDPAITSNAHGPNANITFLEWLNRRPAFKGRVEAVTSWDAFNDILNARRSGLPVNAGWDGGEADAPDDPIAKLQADAPRIWLSARLDGFTQAWAMEALQERKPEVLFVAFDETDDFAHDGHYDQVLWAAHRADGFLARIWAALQADPAYAGRTDLIVTTDHGRGTVGKAGWRGHGKPIYVGSDATWIAAIGPDVKPGARPAGDCATSGQIAATALTALGLDWKAFDPAAAPPLDILKGK